VNLDFIKLRFDDLSIYLLKDTAPFSNLRGNIWQDF